MGFLSDRSEVVLRHLLERNAAAIPDRECVSFEDAERWTYRGAFQQAYKATDRLSEIGVKRGENVLIFLPNGQGWLRAWWGLTSLGAVIVPVNTAYRGEMLRHICDDSQSRHIIIVPELAERLKGLRLNLNIIDPSILSTGSADEPKLDGPIEPWDVHTIMYTSGTTDPTKGEIIGYFKNYRDCDNWEGVATEPVRWMAWQEIFPDRSRGQ